MTKVSVLVPVFNRARYLRQCVDSILNQSYTDIEVLLCDDCSTDNSLDICREYADSDSRVRVFTNAQNTGVYNTRLYRLADVRGEYFTQVDADDWLHKDCIKAMVETAERFGVDVVQTGFVRTIDRWGLLSSKVIDYKTGLWTKERLDQYHHIFTQRVFSNNVWSKLIRTDIIRQNQLEPSDIHYGDDLLFVQEISPAINSVYCLPRCLYYYRTGGSTASFNPRFWTDQSQLYWLRKAYALKYEPEYVPGLTSFYIDLLESVLRLRLFINKSENKGEETAAFLEQFYITEDYTEMVSSSCQNTFTGLLRHKDTAGIIRYVKDSTSRLSVLKTRTVVVVSKWLSRL